MAKAIALCRDGRVLSMFEKHTLKVANEEIELTTYKTTEESKDFFRATEWQNIKVVSVVGQSRIGKSTFQRHLFPEVKFKTDPHVQEPCTQGIDFFVPL